MKINKFHLLGPFNSGTNLISRILEKIDNYSIGLDGQSHIDKHTIDFEKLNNIISNNQDILFIVCYRSFYTLYHSMIKSQYFIKEWNKNIDGSLILYDKKFKNLLDLYNFYYLNYIHLLNKYNNIIFIDYYKLCDINKSYNYINDKLKKFEIKLYDKEIYINILNNKAKKHGSSVNNINEAINKKYKLDELEKNLL